MRRIDASPTSGVSGSVVLPGGTSGTSPFLCEPAATAQQHSGLPWANIALGAPPPSLSEGERTAVAVLAVASADLQTVAAIGMLRCSPGSDEDVESEAGIRALVPVALSGTCAGAVQGALLAIGVAGVLSVAAMCAVKAVKSKDGLGWVEAAAMVRCPGIVIAVWAFVQMGLVVCGARLATAEDGDGGDIVLGVVGVIAGAILPVVCIGLAWGVVSRRCYRLGQVPAAVAGRSGVVVWARSVFLPSYELDAQVYPVSKAFSTVVGRTRRPSCLWAGLSSMQPVVMLLVAFMQGSMCNVILIIAGVIMMLVGALCHVLFRPHRIVASNYLQGIAMALNAALLVIASQLVGDPLNVAALNANSIIAMVQVALSLCRGAHMIAVIIYLRLCGGTGMYVRVDGDTKGSNISTYTSTTRGGDTAPLLNDDDGASGRVHFPPTEKTTSLPIIKPVFDIQAGCCSGSEGAAHSPLSHSIRSFFNPKTNKQFSESIVTTLVNSNEGGRDEVSNIATSARPTTLEEQEEVQLREDEEGFEMDDCLSSTGNNNDDENEGSVGKSKSSATLSFSSSKSSLSSSTLHSNHSSDSTTPSRGEGAHGNGNVSHPPNKNKTNAGDRLLDDEDDDFNLL